ncbi:phosphate transporter family protein, partial [Vibrio parahaemolyticus AQ3810]
RRRYLQRSNGNHSLCDGICSRLKRRSKRDWPSFCSSIDC